MKSRSNILSAPECDRLPVGKLAIWPQPGMQNDLTLRACQLVTMLLWGWKSQLGVNLGPVSGHVLAYPHIHSCKIIS